MNEPTAAQQQQAILAQHEFVELTNKLIKEGIAPQIVLVGLATAAADTITSVFGAEKVAPWFGRQSELVKTLQQGS